MKKIINGKKYDTDTAEFVCFTSYGNGSSDFRHWSEELYRKKTGEYFIYGEGGALSKYACSVAQNEMCGSEQIKPVSYEYAQKFVEEYGTADEYEEFFGEVSEEDPLQVSAKIKASDYQKIRRYAEQNTMTIVDVISKLVESLD